jgi:hypothetical protein
MATKTATAVVNEAAVKAAVHTWAKAETSAIWSLIRVVSKGLIGFVGADRPTRVRALKTWVNQAAEDAWGPGAAKDRAAHISKIFTIAENATEAHYKRWTAEGTGFYKAYAEFAVPQRVKGESTTTKKPDTVAVPTGMKDPIPEGWTADKVKSGAIQVDDPAVAATVPKTGGPLATSAPDPTESWAARIDANKNDWKRLLDKLTEKQHTILEPGMVLDVLYAVGKKQQLLRNTIAVLLQNEMVKACVVDFIKENPTLFEGISVDTPVAAVATKK